MNIFVSFSVLSVAQNQDDDNHSGPAILLFREHEMRHLVFLPGTDRQPQIQRRFCSGRKNRAGQSRQNAADQLQERIFAQSRKPESRTREPRQATGR